MMKTGRAIAAPMVLVLLAASLVVFRMTSFTNVAIYNNETHTLTFKQSSSNSRDVSATASKRRKNNKRLNGRGRGAQDVHTTDYNNNDTSNNVKQINQARARRKEEKKLLKAPEEEEKLLKQQAQFHELTMNNGTNISPLVIQHHPVKQQKNNNNSNNNKHHYHDYAIFIVHYHKTGYVLSREIKNLIGEIEVQANSPNEDPKKYSNLVKFEMSGIDNITKKRITFDQLGNWVNSAFPQRRHLGTTNCPPSPNAPRRKRKMDIKLHEYKFHLKSGTIYIQESPDLYCNDEQLLDAMSTSGNGGTKIIHFVRNPYDMTLSNFFYHSQDPTPEKWGEFIDTCCCFFLFQLYFSYLTNTNGLWYNSHHTTVNYDKPCHNLYMNKESLSSHIIPTLSSWQQAKSNITSSLSAASASTDVLTEKDMNNIVDMCKSLYQQNGTSLENATFYEHLLNLDKYDALRLATAQMTVASSQANKYLAGGDILRMANNIVRFQNIQKSPKSNVQVMTVAMGDFITDTANATMKVLDFVFDDDKKITHEMRVIAAELRAKKYVQKSKSDHVTQGNAEVVESKEELRHMLKNDELLGPVLNLTETLVNEALAASG